MAFSAGRVLVAGAWIVACGVLVGAQAQRADQDRNVIAGRLLVKDSTAPVTGGEVVLHDTNGGPREVARQSVGADGRFLFRNLPAGTYLVSVDSPGYFRGWWGADEPGSSGQPLQLASGRPPADIVVPLVPHATVSGRIYVGDRGVAGAPVRVLTRVYVAGADRWAIGPTTRTDASGDYRLTGLLGGEYLIQAMSPDDGGPRRVVFFPGVATRLSSSPLALSAGDERFGLDFHLDREIGFSVSGRLVGHPRPDHVGLIPRGSADLGAWGELRGRLTAEGTFQFVNVPPGDYVLRTGGRTGQLELLPPGGGPLPPPPPNQGRSYVSAAVASAPPGARLVEWSQGQVGAGWAQFPIQVGHEDLEDLVVPLKSPMSVRGTFKWASPEESWTSFPGLIRLEPADGSPLTGLPSMSRVSGELPGFEIQGVMPGKYILTVAGTFGIKAVEIRGVNRADGLFEVVDEDVTELVVTLTTASAALAGRVDANVRGSVKMSVLAFPADPYRWANYGLAPRQIRTAPVSSTGGYRITGLPAGDYLVAALPASQAAKWMDPSRLRAIAADARRISLAWGQTATLNLQAAQHPH
jgi:hypothetical protein